jgi:hypothetical protein
MAENEPNEDIQGINFEPNYDALFQQFTREAKIQADNFLFDAPEGDAAEAKEKLEGLRALQSVLAPINIAVQSLTRLQQVVELREALHSMVESVVQRADRLENDIATRDDLAEPEPDLEEVDEPDEDAITTSDHTNFYQYGKLMFRVLGDDGVYKILESKRRWEGNFDTIEAAVKAWMDAEQFWPNCYLISDHGNAHRMNLEAEL